MTHGTVTKPRCSVHITNCEQTIIIKNKWFIPLLFLLLFLPFFYVAKLRCGVIVMAFFWLPEASVLMLLCVVCVSPVGKTRSLILCCSWFYLFWYKEWRQRSKRDECGWVFYLWWCKVCCHEWHISLISFGMTLFCPLFGCTNSGQALPS